MYILNDLVNEDLLAGAKGIIFDCDGVLINSLPGNIWFYNHFREKFGQPPMTPELEHYVHISNVWESFRKILPEEHYEAALAYKAEFDYLYCMK